MAVDATVIKDCGTGNIYLVPGALGVRPDGPYFSPPTDEIVVDVCPTGDEVVAVRNPTVTLRLLAPDTCEFLLPNHNPPNYFRYRHPNGDTTRVQAVFELPEPTTLRRLNSLSYRFPIAGRGAADCEVEIVMSAETADSITPGQYRCQPALAIAEGREPPAPQFGSKRFGDPDYAQLSTGCPTPIATGAADGSAMGAFHLLHQPQREANLRMRLDEYLPIGLDAGVIYVDYTHRFEEQP